MGLRRERLAFEAPGDLWIKACPSRRRTDVTPLLSATLPNEETETAFGLAGNRSRAVKGQSRFDFGR